MKSSTLNKIDKAIEEFKAEIQSEIEISKADPETKYLCEQIARQTYYTLLEIKNALSKD
ncbi:hypothetical protein [Tepidanaerobacter syntrophicus]|uniref:hypothetical protein n=1 Tax=Tepidanaerobacter syntrophicus TaxID=224999 RepID=UPI001BD39342|nr:hypothetical protein [Tepidanaerobacter syntrophicus]